MTTEIITMTTEINTVYVVLFPSFEYNDEYYYHGDGYDRPRFAFLDAKEALAWAVANPMANPNNGDDNEWVINELGEDACDPVVGTVVPVIVR